MDMADLLDYSLKEIDNLYDYYKNQINYIAGRIKEQGERNKYGMLLAKFFNSLVDKERKYEFTDDERQIIDELVEDYSVVSGSDQDNTRVAYRLKKTDLTKNHYEIDPVKASENVMNILNHKVILSESVLMMLLVRYEDSISQLYRLLIQKYPDAFLSDKTIKYSELLKVGTNVEDIRNQFVEKEIDRIMYEPIDNWYDAFCKRQKARFLFANDLFDRFKEIYYRRNLVVHNQGIVNETYLSFVKNSKAKKGDRLIVDSKYLECAFSVTSLMIIDTFFGLRKQTDNKDKLVDWLMSYGYTCLKDEKWEKAEYIFVVLLQDEHIMSIDKVLAQINHWIAVKHIKGLDSIRDEISDLDVSALQLQFAVAKAALLENNSEIVQMLEVCLDNGDILPDMIKEWPLFIEFRATEEYKQFIERHSDKMGDSMYTVQSDEESNLINGQEKTNKIDDEDACQ